MLIKGFIINHNIIKLINNIKVIFLFINNKRFNKVYLNKCFIIYNIII